MPKRVVRLGLLLAAPDPAHAARPEPTRLHVLPRTRTAISGVADPARRELLTAITAQFTVAYSLTQDADLARVFDGLATQGVEACPRLPDSIAAVLGDLTPSQQALAADVGLAHDLSGRMIAHADTRGTLVANHADEFDIVLREVIEAARPGLEPFGAQIAVTGSYAARLHARWQSAPLERFEPVRRYFVQLQCPSGTSETAVMAAVRGPLTEVLGAAQHLKVLPLDMQADSRERSLSVVWQDEVAFADGPDYRPQVLKVRAKAVTGTSICRRSCRSSCRSSASAGSVGVSPQDRQDQRVRDARRPCRGYERPARDDVRVRRASRLPSPRLRP